MKACVPALKLRHAADAGRAHDGPGGRPVRVSGGTLDRWRRAYESGGFDALVPSPRQCQPRAPDEVLVLAEALKREKPEKPERTAAQVRRILQLTAGWTPSDRTLQRLFGRLELSAPPREQEESSSSPMMVTGVGVQAAVTAPNASLHHWRNRLSSSI